jgi:ketosteroid isomerase-like protein
MSTSEDNLAVVRKAYELFGSGDIDQLMESIDEACEYDVAGPPEKLPWVRVYRGHSQIRQFFSKLDEHLDISVFEPREFIAQGNTVVVLGDEECRVKATGKVYADEWVHVLKIEDRKIKSLREYFHTASAIDATTV